MQLLSPEGTIVKTFDSFTDCGKFLGVTRKTISNKLEKNQAGLIEGKLLNLSKGDVNVPEEN